MSEERKTILINTDLFKIPEKKKPGRKPNTEKIKIKPEMSSAKTKTLRNQILKLIRSKQQEEYKKMFSPSSITENLDSASSPPSSSSLKTEFTNDFKKSFDYLSALAKKEEEENKQKENHQRHHQHTLKHYSVAPSHVSSSSSQSPPPPPTPPPPSSPIIHSPSLINNPVGMPLEMEQLNQQIQNKMPLSLNHHHHGHPGYGCLKNGNYPTYRTWKHQSSSPAYVAQPIISNYSPPNFTTQSFQPNSQITNETKNASLNEIRKNEDEESPSPIKKSASSILIEQIQNKKPSLLDHPPHSSKEQQKYRIMNKIRRKIYKRTFRVGKLPHEKKIGCLISNKTLRQKIQQVCYDIKKTDMKEVRKYLLKHGLIKVGTNAPNDVLRKMYECVNTVCGQVENHNADTLLYNFMNVNENNLYQ